MNTQKLLLIGLLSGSATLASAQSTPGGTGSSTFFFSTDFTEIANSGMGATSGAPGNQAATFDDEEILMVAPDATAPYFAVSNFSFVSAAAWFGDNDGDGIYDDTIISEVDALYLPSSAPNPPSVFDFYVSFRFFTKTGGVLAAGGVPIEDGDIVRLLPGGGFVSFLTEAQVATAMNSASPSTSIDVNAFTVDEATGDLYFSMSSTQSVGGTDVFDGGIVRLAAGNYVANADGTVASVTPDTAEIVLHESEVDAMFLNAGLLNTFDNTGLEIDPGGGFFVSTSTTAVLPNLLLCDEQAANGPAIVSTAGGLGAVYSEGGIMFDNGPALGLNSTGFSGVSTRNLSALAYRATPLAATPLMLDVFPMGITTPTTSALDIGGGVPGGIAILFLNFAEGSAAGGFTGRTPTSSPLFSFLEVPGSYPEVYVDDLLDPLFSVLAPFPIQLDAQGYGSFSLPVSSYAPGVAVSFQAYEVLSGALSTPVILVTE